MNSLQLQASNPEISTWVSASAGTGKTKILTDRVLRLLLGGATFNKILCLTFTNAAAGEMKERIAASLSLWSRTNDINLAAELYKTMGHKASAYELEKAGKLYELYLRSPDRINIQTIHSFCHALLKKFPIEAGVSPSFKIIDEAKSHSILQQIKSNLLNQPDLEPINSYLTMNFHELTIDEILREIVEQRTKFLNGVYQVNNLYDESLAIINELTKACNQHYHAFLHHPIIRNIVGVNVSALELKKFFLTTTGQKRQRIVTKKIAAVGSNLYSDLEQIQQQVFLLDQLDRTKQLEAHSKLLSLLGSKILESYELHKSAKGLLDYDDLIIYTNKLLKASEAKEWVLYKLDGGIDHLLVDEAQDTSATQWQIVESMIEEFYAGDASDPEKNRTVFVVGDEKQSIFSFQGADVASFAGMNQLLKSKMILGGKQFEDVNLEISYRSAKEILDVVYQVFARIGQQMPALFTASLTPLSAFRANHSGSVELWPLCSLDKEEEQFWQVSSKAVTSVKTELARKISRYIKNQIASGRILPSTGKAIAARDFMILFRKRDELTLEVIKALQSENLAVAGLDRISLGENLAVLDLLSVGKFVINNHDNLNLGALLKSPLIGLSEQDLYDISTTRNNNSIWTHLQSLAVHDQHYKECYDRLLIFIDIFNQTNVGNFFQYIVDVQGYRNILNAACGLDSNDAIDELLYTCSDFAAQNDTSLQSFIFWLESYNTSIKRDNTADNKIRIMTLHAAKGLQSPVVILCDTTSLPTSSNRFVWDKDGKTLSAQNADYLPDYYLELKAVEQSKAYAEYLRLLYVGMTRAEDHLIICGYQNERKLPENCWYELVRLTMTEIAVQKEDEALIYGLLPVIARRPQADAATQSSTVTSEQQTVRHPEEAVGFYPRHPEEREARRRDPESEGQRSSSGLKLDPYVGLRPPLDDGVALICNVGLPSLSSNGVTTLSPLSKNDPMAYGLVFHKILEDSLSNKDLEIMKTHPLINTLAASSQQRLKASCDKIIANKEFHELIRKDLKTEITLGTNTKDGVKIGRIDLMVIDQEQVYIIDYKSDRTPALRAEDIPENYSKQLLSYKKMVQEIYPDKTIRTMFLWLENGRLQEI